MSADYAMYDPRSLHLREEYKYYIKDLGNSIKNRKSK